MFENVNTIMSTPPSANSLPIVIFLSDFMKLLINLDNTLLSLTCSQLPA